ncbi:MAG: AarF/ABC1/UbiB kinase family protein, partial [Myxococcaceae bacterium]|nr:AarF/ABC1/UbiB kinase family protein [Myxococcaceae bacterium]
LEAGKFRVNIRSDQLQQLTQALRAAALVAFLGLCASGLIVGAFISLSQTPGTVGGLALLGWVGVVSSAMLVGAVFSWYLFAGRVRKVRLSRWLRPRR